MENQMDVETEPVDGMDVERNGKGTHADAVLDSGTEPSIGDAPPSLNAGLDETELSADAEAEESEQSASSAMMRSSDPRDAPMEYHRLVLHNLPKYFGYKVTALRFVKNVSSSSSSAGINRRSELKLFEWLVDQVIDWLIDWLIDLFIYLSSKILYWLIDGLDFYCRMCFMCLS